MVSYYDKYCGELFSEAVIKKVVQTLCLRVS